MSDIRTTSLYAASSLKLGLLSLVFTVFTGLPAIVRGVRGLAEIRRSPNRLAGRALAWGGIGTGVLGLAWGAFLLMLVVKYVQDSADRMH